MTNLAALLDNLSDAEQGQLHDMLAYKRARIVISDGPSRDELALWTALQTALGVQRPSVVALQAFMASYGITKYRDRLAMINSYIEDSCGAVMRRGQREMVMLCVMRAIISYLQGRDTACAPKVVLNSLIMVADAVDAQFPGYARAKLLHRIAPLARGGQAMDGLGAQPS